MFPMMLLAQLFIAIPADVNAAHFNIFSPATGGAGFLSDH
jgi:hypothetical protein